MAEGEGRTEGGFLLAWRALTRAPPGDMRRRSGGGPGPVRPRPLAAESPASSSQPAPVLARARADIAECAQCVRGDGRAALPRARSAPIGFLGCWVSAARPPRQTPLPPPPDDGEPATRRAGIRFSLAACAAPTAPPFRRDPAGPATTPLFPRAAAPAAPRSAPRAPPSASLLPAASPHTAPGVSWHRHWHRSPAVAATQARTARVREPAAGARQ